MRKPIDLEQFIPVTDTAAAALLGEAATTSECTLEVCLRCALHLLELNQQDPESRYNGLMALDYLGAVVEAVNGKRVNHHV
ncbi:hypothetical protein [Deefgea salmonis]|uniref:DUF3077 domain-containing protein n=1 Tax=Deefgea salmonis TaxID=2875502 RepID=A0ABS8BIG9_9NEIS|nr:hypothetical protein [Deefgea salmonis]MCB5195515.1 hypothetical protein [Deefgea salmonis]